MSSSRSQRTRAVWSWMSVIGFMSVVNAAGGQLVNLETPPEVLASCGDNVTLMCNVTSTQPLDVSLLAWLDGTKKLCQNGKDPLVPDVLCQSEAEPFQHQLSVTLLNASPVHAGKYICKLQSTLGVEDGSTVLRVQGCLGSSNTSINDSHAECRFDGVNPGSTVHWFQGQDNLTHSAFTTETVDGQGLMLWSTLDLKTGNQNQPVNCSLWVHVENKYLSTMQLSSVQANNSTSAGSSAMLWWICVLVEAVILKSMF